MMNLFFKRECIKVESIFKIDNNRECFYQWDIGQKLVVLDKSISAVNFQAEEQEEAYKIPVVNGKTQVPDELLQTAGYLVVWAMVYDGSQYTKTVSTFGIIARQKPSDYVFTPTEYETFASKLDKNLGVENEGKFLSVSEDGEITPVELEIPDPKLSDFWKTQFDGYNFKDVSAYMNNTSCLFGISENPENSFFIVDDWYEQITLDSFQSRFFMPVYNFFGSTSFGKQNFETGIITPMLNTIDYFIEKGVMADWSTDKRYLAINYISNGTKGYIMYYANINSTGIFKILNIYMGGYRTGYIIATKQPSGNITIMGRKDNNVKEISGNKYFKTDANGYSSWVAEDLAQKPLIVLFSGNNLNNDSTCDKTFTQIKNAIESGKEIILRYENGNNYFELQKNWNTDANIIGSYYEVYNPFDLDEGVIAIRCSIDTRNVVSCLYTEV